MSSNQSEKPVSEEASESKPENICQYLGLYEDTQSFFQFASNSNYCHRPSESVVVHSSHQRHYCLVENHVGCPLYQPDWDGSFPSGIVKGKGSRKRRSRRKKRNVIITGALATLICMVLVGGVAWTSGRMRAQTLFYYYQVRYAIFGTPVRQVGPVPPTETATPEPTATETATLKPPATLAPSFTPFLTDTPAPEITPTATETAFPTPGPAPGTPFGPDEIWLIHVVQPGESFNSIGQRYGTDPEVLQFINPTNEGVLLWEGRQIVVPIGINEIGNLPQFEIVFTQEAVNIFSLADFYDTDPEEIRYYNQLGPGETIPFGRWLIIPLIP